MIKASNNPFSENPNLGIAVNKEVNTYALMIEIGTPLNLTKVKVLNDENKGMTNTVYHLYPDGVRMWIAAVEEI